MPAILVKRVCNRSALQTREPLDREAHQKGHVRHAFPRESRKTTQQALCACGFLTPGTQHAPDMDTENKINADNSTPSVFYHRSISRHIGSY